MPWRVRFERRALKELGRFGQAEQVRISKFIRDRLVRSDNPRAVGEALRGPFANRWKYRVGDYRIIAVLEDEVVTITVVRIGHRSDVYR